MTPNSLSFPASGGMATTRTPTPVTPEQIAAHEADQADALAYLTRTGNHDIAEILGLTDVAPARKKSVAVSDRRRAIQQCPACQQEYQPTTARQITCSRACSRKYGHRRAKKREI